jgi:hypothetical protein
MTCKHLPIPFGTRTSDIPLHFCMGVQMLGEVGDPSESGRGCGWSGLKKLAQLLRYGGNDSSPSSDSGESVAHW